MEIRVLLAPLAFAAGFAIQAAPVEAASAVQSANCANGICAQFDFDDPIPVIKSFQFSMPAAGTATVTFGGTMFCAASGTTVDKVIDINAVISTGATGTVPITTPSFLRLAHVLKDAADHTFDSSTSFNLQTTRVIPYTSGGSKTVYFRMARARQDSGVTCYVYGGSFTVIRTP